LGFVINIKSYWVVDYSLRGVGKRVGWGSKGDDIQKGGWSVKGLSRA
jgi:hypothetical protein